MDKLLNLITDPYERKARATPGLLAIIPLLTAFLCYYGPKDPSVAAIGGLLVGCGSVYALGSLTRMMGKKKEEILIQKWGGRPTTIILRHRDEFLDIVTKQRYHDYILNKLGIQIPTMQQEIENPQLADDQYIGATRHLIELTRGDKGLLFTENVNYGFARNMHGVKPVGICTSFLGLIFGLIFAGVFQFNPFELNVSQLRSPGVSGVITLAVSIAMLLIWTVFFDVDGVRRIGYVYAERLFEQLPNLPERKQATLKRSSKKAVAKETTEERLDTE